MAVGVGAAVTAAAVAAAAGAAAGAGTGGGATGLGCDILGTGADCASVAPVCKEFIFSCNASRALWMEASSAVGVAFICEGGTAGAVAAAGAGCGGAGGCLACLDFFGGG